MDLWSAFDQMGTFMEQFLPRFWFSAFDGLFGFFSADNYGIISVFPFFVVTAVALIFWIIKGIINVFNDL